MRQIENQQSLGHLNRSESRPVIPVPPVSSVDRESYRDREDDNRRVGQTKRPGFHGAGSIAFVSSRWDGAWECSTDSILNNSSLLIETSGHTSATIGRTIPSPPEQAPSHSAQSMKVDGTIYSDGFIKMV